MLLYYAKKRHNKNQSLEEIIAELKKDRNKKTQIFLILFTKLKKKRKAILNKSMKDCKKNIITSFRKLLKVRKNNNSLKKREREGV